MKVSVGFLPSTTVNVFVGLGREKMPDRSAAKPKIV